MQLRTERSRPCHSKRESNEPSNRCLFWGETGPTAFHDPDNNQDSEFCRAICDFLRHLEAAGRTPSTILAYRKSLIQLAQMLGDLEMTKIDSSALEEAFLRIVRASPSGMPLAPTTANRMRSTYRSFFAWCFSTGRMAANPAMGLRLEKARSLETAAFARNETATFLRMIRQSRDPFALRDEVLFSIYAFTGIRKAKALGLRVVDYDSLKMVLCIPKTKGGVHETKVVPGILAEVLEGYLQGLIRNGSGESDFLFPGMKKGAPLSSRQVQARFEQWKEISGLRRELTIHSFRVGFATRVHECSGDVLLTSKALGHRDVRSTERYVRLDVEKIRSAVERAFEPCQESREDGAVTFR